MRRLALVSSLVFAALAGFGLGPSAASAGETLAATCPVPATSGIKADYSGARQAQTFTPSLSGSLTRAQATVAEITEPTLPWDVQILAVDGTGKPTGMPLAETTVAGSTGIFTLNAIFATPASVLAGQTYAVAISRPGEAGDSWAWYYQYGGLTECTGRLWHESSANTWNYLAPSGNGSDANFSVYVTSDSTAPVLAVSGASEEATSSAGAVVSFVVSATDPDDATSSLVIGCDHTSGSAFPIGTTPVSCTATDPAGNVGKLSFDVVVAHSLAPVLVVPANATAEATGAAGAVVAYSAPTASDVVDGDLSSKVSCDHASGSVFALGTTTVKCSVTDSGGNTANGSFTVKVRDTTPPVIATPVVVAEATSASGAVVNYAASAHDLVDGAVTPACTPKSGTLFGFGKTVVTCKATDKAGNTATATFDVVVSHTHGPEITVPAVVYASAVNASGATVHYTASAYDVVDGPVRVSCSPAPGSMFRLGTTTVTCTAHDRAGHITTASFPVVVRDTTAPVIGAASITAEAASASGAMVSYLISAHDNVDGPVAVSCSPPSGSTFPIGTTTVLCSARDAAGNVAYKSFHVVITHGQGPLFLVPDTLVAEATGPSGAKVSYQVSAYDAVDGTVTPSCTPRSGSTFKLGVTHVTCTATDSHGHAGSASFHVVVRDTTPPTLKLPGPITVDARGPKDAAVTYTATANDLVDGKIRPRCKPASGSRFGIGTTLVRCTASDKAGNSNAASFTITINPTAPWITQASQSSKRWRAGNGLPHYTRKTPIGTTFSYRLSEPARVTFAFTKTVSGRRVGRRCVATTNNNQNRPRCTRTITVATLRHQGHKGRNTLHFEGRINRHKRLAPGTYTLRITATHNGHRSDTTTLRFTIVR